MERSENKSLLSSLVGRLPQSLAVKWTLAIALLLALGMGLLGNYLIRQQEGALESQSTQLGELLAEQLARVAAEPLLAEKQNELELLVRRELDNELVVGAAVLNRDGEYLAKAGETPTRAEVAQRTSISADPDPWIADRWRSGQRIRASIHVAPSKFKEVQEVKPSKFKEVQVGTIILSLNREQLEDHRRNLVNALVATTVLLIAFVGLLAFPLARWMSEPIRRLVAEEQKKGDVQTARSELAFGGTDEVGYLAKRLQLLTSDVEDKRQVEDALNRYLSPGVVRSVLAAEQQGLELEGRSLRGSVLFCDIVDFTRLSQRHTPEDVAELVNDYFGAFARSGTFFRGTVDKFIGDCVMILFGVPEHDSDHALHAVECGTAIVQLSQAISVRRRATGKPTVNFRVAINSGLMRAGNLGNQERMEFTVVGSSVNLAARLCERSPINSLAVTADTLSESGVAAEAVVESMGPIEIKGYDEPLSAFVVHDLGEHDKAEVRACLQEVTDAIQVPV